VEADDPARNRCGCFLPDLTRLATAPSADFRAGIWATLRHSASRRTNPAISFTVHLGDRKAVLLTRRATPMPLPFFILTLAAAAGAQAQPAVPTSIHPRPGFISRGSRRLFISPMGEPFSADRGGDALGAWFQQTDTNHDGVITVAEMKQDAERYFAVLDTNHDGEIDPDEISHYEQTVAPQFLRNSNLLGLAEPVASTDTNFNRGVSLQEFTVAAGRRFAALDVDHLGKLTLDGLRSLRPPEPERDKKDATDPTQQLDANADTGGG